MDFLDKLILGPDTPLHSDNVQYPSKVYRRRVINNKVNNIKVSDIKEDMWEFWSLFLVKPLNRKEGFYNYRNLKDELRLAVWDKLIGNITPNIDSTSNNELNNELNIDKIVERDNFLLKCVISKFRDHSEEEIFNILRTVVDTNNITNFVLLVDFTYHLVNMPYSDKLKLKRVIVGLFGKYNMRDLFIINKDDDKLDDDNNRDDVKLDDDNNRDDDNIKDDVKFDKNNKDDDDNNIDDDKLDKKITKFESLVYKDPPSLYKLIDLVLFCNTSILEVLEDDFIPSLKDIPDTVLIREETYFDFLMIQNENIRAQEVIKEDLMRVEKENEELKKENQELKNHN